MQILLQNGPKVIIKWDSFDILLSRVITKQGKWYYKVGKLLLKSGVDITKWGNYYKVVRYKKQMTETGEGIDFGNLLLDSALICLATENFPLKIPGKLKF